MNDSEDRILELALEELHGSRGDGEESARLLRALGKIERRLGGWDAVNRRPARSGMKAAAVAASVLSLSLVSWFILGHFGRDSQVMNPTRGDSDSGSPRAEAGQDSPPPGRIRAATVARSGSSVEPDEGQNVTIDLGSDQGVRLQSRFEVVRGPEVLGSLVIRKVENTWAMGTYRARQPRGEPARVGDAVRPLIATAENVPSRQGDPSDGEIRKWVEQLSDPDGAVRDRASTALKGKGPELLGRLREELSRTHDAEARPRLEGLIRYWTHDVAARVGGEIITWEEVNATLRGIRPREISEELRRSALLSLVEERAFLQEAHRRRVVIPEEELREAARQNVEAAGGEAAHRAMLRAKGMSLEDEAEQLRRRLSAQKLYPRILEEARATPGADPFKLDLNETPREELRRWYDAHPDKFSAIDRVEVCWVELRFEGEKDKAAKKAFAEALVAKMQSKTPPKNSLGWACSELGVKENIHISGFDRGGRYGGPFGEETRKLLFDGFKFGEARVIDEGTSPIFVLQLYDRARRVTETFEQAEPNIRALLENQRLETNRKRIRDGLLERAQIWPPDLFKGPR